MSDPDSRELGKETPTDAVPQDPETPVTLSEPEPVQPGGYTAAVEDAEVVVPAEETTAQPEPIIETAETVQGPDPIPQRAAPVKPAKRGAGGFFGLVLGGVIAAGAGFGLAKLVPEGWPVAIGGVSGEQLDAQAREIAELRAAIEAGGATPANDQVTALATEVEQAKAQAATAAEAAAALEQRLAAMESAPGADGGVSPAALAEFEEQIAALRSQIEAGAGNSSAVTDIQAAAEAAKAQLTEAQTQADEMKAAVEATARAATTSAAVSRVRAALDSGEAFSAPLDDLAGAGLEIPAVLIEGAAGGIPTNAELADAFPDAARAALDESLIASMGDSFSDRVSAFVRTQAGARSLTPREGTDPDAVLSRAEAAVRSGDLKAALAEIATLPEAGQVAMADWTAQAQKRVEATDAVAALAASAEAK